MLCQKSFSSCEPCEAVRLLASWELHQAWRWTDVSSRPSSGERCEWMAVTEKSIRAGGRYKLGVVWSGWCFFSCGVPWYRQEFWGEIIASFSFVWSDSLRVFGFVRWSDLCNLCAQSVDRWMTGANVFKLRFCEEHVFVDQLKLLGLSANKQDLRVETMAWVAWFRSLEYLKCFHSFSYHIK